MAGSSKEYCVPGDDSPCDAPVLELRMDEMTGTTAFDSSGNGNDGTLENGPTWDPVGKFGSAIYFDGTGDRIGLGTPSVLDLSGSDLTMSAWVNMAAHTTFGHIISNAGGGVSKDYRMQLGSGSGNDLELNVFNDAGGSAASCYLDPLVAGDWHHLVYTYSGGYGRCYFDGSLKDTSTLFSGTRGEASATEVTVGSRNSGSYFNGTIDDAKVYDYARTPAQIAWDYNRGKPIAEWKMSEGDGTTVHDSSGNGNDGTLTAATWQEKELCKTGKCLYFDGEDLTEFTADAQDNMEQFTTCAWFKVDSLTNPDSETDLMLINKGWYLRLQAGILEFNVPTSGSYITTESSTLSANEWYHVCAVNNGFGNLPEMYINGEDDSNDTYGGTGSVSDDSGDLVRVGATYPNEYANNFYGYIDEVKIYNYALTAEQVKNDYNGGAALMFGE